MRCNDLRDELGDGRTALEFCGIGVSPGDIALEALRLDGGAQITAADFSIEMMRVGRRRPGGG